jgi:hypothetical protein
LYGGLTISAGISFVVSLGGGFMRKAGKNRRVTTPLTNSTISAPEEVPDHEAVVMENLAAAGGRRLEQELEEYHSVSPVLTAGDIDAEWQDAENTGAETPGGHMATPDQDNVDQIARAVGMELQDNQELHTHEEIFAKRDQHRWELNRSSADGDSV